MVSQHGLVDQAVLGVVVVVVIGDVVVVVVVVSKYGWWWVRWGDIVCPVVRWVAGD